MKNLLLIVVGLLLLVSCKKEDQKKTPHAPEDLTNYEYRYIEEYPNNYYFATVYHFLSDSDMTVVDYVYTLSDTENVGRRGSWNYRLDYPSKIISLYEKGSYNLDATYRFSEDSICPVRISNGDTTTYGGTFLRVR